MENSAVAYSQASSWSKEVKKSGVIEPIEMNSIIEQVAYYYEISEEEIYVARKGPGSKNTARWMAMKLSKD